MHRSWSVIAQVDVEIKNNLYRNWINVLAYCKYTIQTISLFCQCKTGIEFWFCTWNIKDIHSLVIQSAVKRSLTAIDKVTWRVCIVNIMTFFNVKNEILFSYLSIMFIPTRTMCNNNDVLWFSFYFQEIVPKLHIFIQPFPPYLQNFISNQDVINLQTNHISSIWVKQNQGFVSLLKINCISL